MAQRNLISRATALCVGLGICFVSYRCFVWAYRLANDSLIREQRANEPRLHRRDRPYGPLALPLCLGGVTGLVGLATVGYAILPGSALHSAGRRGRDD